MKFATFMEPMTRISEDLQALSPSRFQDSDVRVSASSCTFATPIVTPLTAPFPDTDGNSGLAARPPGCLECLVESPELFHVL